jgi:DNA gyrase subunit A
MGRNTQGVRLINLNDGDEIADVTPMAIEDDEEEDDVDDVEDVEGVEDAEAPDEEEPGD